MQRIWGHLRGLAHAVVIWTRPHSEIPAATDGRHIWVDPKLTSTELRCVLAHEAIHVQHGHSSCQSPSVERQVCLEVARFLITFEDLQNIVGWSSCPSVMAEELGVTEQVLIDRLATLDGDQLQVLWPPGEHIA